MSPSSDSEDEQSGGQPIRKLLRAINGCANIPSLVAAYIIYRLAGSVSGCLRDLEWRDPFPRWLVTTTTGDTIFTAKLESYRCRVAVGIGQQLVQLGIVLALFLVTPARPSGWAIVLPLLGMALTMHAVPNPRLGRYVWYRATTARGFRKLVSVPVGYLVLILSGPHFGYAILAVGLLYLIHSWSIAVFLLVLYLSIRLSYDAFQLCYTLYLRLWDDESTDWECQECGIVHNRARASCLACGSHGLEPETDSEVISTSSTWWPGSVRWIVAFVFGVGIFVALLGTGTIFIEDGTFTATSATAAITGPSYERGLNTSALQSSVHEDINRYRSGLQLQPLSRDRQLDSVATEYARYWANHGQLPRENLSERRQRFRQYGVNCTAPTYIGMEDPFGDELRGDQKAYLNESRIAQSYLQTWRDSNTTTRILERNATRSGSSTLITDNGTAYFVTTIC